MHSDLLSMARHDKVNAKLTISIGGKAIKNTTQRLMVRRLAARSASGNIQATRLLIDMIMQVSGPSNRGGEATRLLVQDQDCSTANCCAWKPNLRTRQMN